MKVKIARINRTPVQMKAREGEAMAMATSAAPQGESFGKFVVPVNDETEEALWLKAECVAIDVIMHARSDGIFKVFVKIGGYDESGVFHPDTRYKVLQISQPYKGHEELWDALDLRRTTPTDETIMSHLHRSGAISRFANYTWGVEADTAVEDDDGNVIAPFRVVGVEPPMHPVKETKGQSNVVA